MATQFQAPISPADREAAWGWSTIWGAQRPDQHVRAWLMADDGAVLDQMQGAFVTNACYNPPHDQQQVFQ